MKRPVWGGGTLVVDHSPERLEFFCERVAGCVVATNDEAIASFRARPFGTVFLDFDLAGSRSGADIAYWMTRRLHALRAGFRRAV